MKQASGWALAILFFLGLCGGAYAQSNTHSCGPGSAASPIAEAAPDTNAKAGAEHEQNAAILQELESMRLRIEQLEAQLKEQDESEASARDKAQASAARTTEPAATAVGAPLAEEVPALLVRAPAPAGEKTASSKAPAEAAAIAASTQTGLNKGTESSFQNVLRGTSVNFLFDGYYGYNFDAPIGRANLLRAYDVSSNSFSINQADLVLENAPDPKHGKRYGARIDFQYGQATQTLQGNRANEARPEIYRALFQAYGTYVVPAGSGLRVDFGKWASALGYENNYTKDQTNYSRSFWFDFLPFYHMGARASYAVNHWLTANYWVVNGAQQTEDFNRFKDQLFGAVLQPKQSVSWTVNYYLGQEHPDFAYVAGGTGLPVMQGQPFAPIANAPTGRLHILDSYVSWNASPKLSLALEGDYVIERLFTTSAPAHTEGGAAYVRYQLTPKFALASRAEYLSDRGGLFSGATQALKEVTLTGQYQVAPGFMMFDEWRRDFSNRPYFLTDTLGLLKNEQMTATVGLVWWFGPKTGTW